MSTTNQPDDELRRQVGQHIDSLRAAGVEWVPNGPIPTIPARIVEQIELPVAPPVETIVVQVGVAAPVEPPKSLFEPLLTSAPLTSDERRLELTVLADRVAGCTRCPELASTRYKTVFGVGPLNPELCFIGEAPGADENRSGEPFVGLAGQLLTRIILACGLKREEVYICNIIKCRPPGNRQPLPDEAANCREYLERQLELVQPKFICALGATAAQNLLKTTTAIGKLRGRFMDYQGIPVLCTFHPSFLLRAPERKKDVWEDMKMLLARMGRAVPERKPPAAGASE